MDTEWMPLLIVISAPAAIVLVAAIIRGYHISIHVWRTHKRESDSE